MDTEAIEIDDIPDAVGPIQEIDGAEPLEMVEPSEPAEILESQEAPLEPNEAEDIIELGDYVVVDTLRYGRIIGTVVYRSLERISIQPNGISNFLQHLTVYQPSEDELEEGKGEEFDEEDGVQAYYIIEKRTVTTFVEQHNLRVGQTIDTFDADHQPALTYEVVAVDVETDAVTLRDPNDPEQPLEIVFGGIGLELDAPFAVLRIRPVLLEELKANTQSEGEEVEEVEEVEVEADAEAEEEADEEGIEVVGVVEIAQAKVFREAAAYEQRIPDDLQKIDALNDFLSGLNPSVQKDPRAVRSIRILVETLFHLKQETVQYNNDGSIQGPKAVTIQTLRELIERVPLPLGRPVLAVNKRIYDFEGDADVDGIQVVNFVNELKAQQKEITKTVSAAKGSAPREWRDQQEDVKLFGSPWRVEGGNSHPEEATEPVTSRQWTALADTEFFRVPSIDDDLRDVPGLQATRNKDPNTVRILDTVPFGMERALATTYRKSKDRVGHGGQKQTLHPADAAPLASYLVFPLSVLSHGLGATRTRLLAHDSARSRLPRIPTNQMLEQLGDPEEYGDATELLMLKDDDYDLQDYLESMNMPSVLSVSDTMDLLIHYGLDRFELTEDLYTVLQDKAEAAQAQLVSALATLRALLAGIEEPKAPEGATRLPAFFATLRKQPLLLAAMEEFEHTHPNVMQTSTASIGLLAHLLRHLGNYAQVAAGETPLLVAHAFQQAGLDEYLRHIRVAQLLRVANETKAERPKKNSCPHVASLVTIRRIPDDGERFLQLTTFFKRYQGPRDQNWINCTSCKEHLLCMHERLQIQAFLNAKEKATIEKQIILGFSGGVFQGKYICRNCGQAIRDLDFENNIEFDDDGKPKSGTAVLEDQDAMLEMRLEEIVRAPIDDDESRKGSESDQSLTAEERKVYYVARELAERIGVTVEFAGYRRIIDDVQIYMQTLPSREDYGSRKKLMYEVFLARYFVTATAAYLLLEIQSHTPAYLVRFTLMGCPDPGFEGWPLATDRSALQGVRYIACAVSATTRKDPPWSETGFAQVADDAKRLAGITQYVESVLDQSLYRADVQGRLALKRRYVQDVLGRSVEGDTVQLSKERVMPSFLPELVVLTASEQAAQAITPEVLAQQGASGQTALAKLWIRQSHVAARQTARLVRGTPFSETTCCTAKLTEPAALGSKKMSAVAEQAAREKAAPADDGEAVVVEQGELESQEVVFPELAPRALRPMKQGSFLLTNFHPREVDIGVVEPNADLYYRIFLKCCFTGPRVGHLHEPGLTNRCMWCGLQFPTHPAVMDTDTEGKAALNGVDTNTDAFTRLLDKIHTVNQVPKIEKRGLQPVDSLMKEFGAVHPTPFSEWQDILRVTLEQCQRLPPTAQKDEVAQAVGQLSLMAREFEDQVHQGRRFPPAYRTLMGTLVDLPWSNFFAVVQTYFMIPIQRLLTQYNPKVLSLSLELSIELSETHVDKDIKPILEREVAYLSQFEKVATDPRMDFARQKLTYFLEQWRVLLPFAHRIRPASVPGKERMLGYVKRALWYGILGMLLDSGMAPKGTSQVSVMASVSDPSARQVLDIIAALMKKFNEEKLSFNEKEIKNMMAAREEMERVSVIKRFHNMTDEEKAVERMNKVLGIGEWAVGGSKLIYAYDQEYYDKEREKRIEAGIFDFAELAHAPMGGDKDEWGAPIAEEAGYDMDLNPHAQEDE